MLDECNVHRLHSVGEKKRGETGISADLSLHETPGRPGSGLIRKLWLLFLLCHLGMAWAADRDGGLSSLTVVYRLDSAPLQFRNEQGQPDGLFIDLWKLWSDKSGIAVRFVGAYNKEAQRLLQEGQADVLAGLFANSRREAFLDFSRPVLKATYYIYVRDSLSTIRDLEDLKGHLVGVTAGSFHEDFLRSRYPELPLMLYPGYEELFSAVAGGEVDAIVTQPIYLQHSYFKHGFRVGLRRLQPPLYERVYRAAVKKGRKDLLDLIDQGLSRITGEERAAISERWVGLGWSRLEGGVPGLTEAEKAWLKQHPVIPVGGESDWPPFDFADESGTHQGVAAEFLRKMEQLLGVRFDVVTSLSWQEVMDKVRSGELYFACTMVETPSRRKDFLFTPPYHFSPAAMVVKRNDNRIQRLEDLADKRVAIVKGYSVSEYLRRRFPDFIQVDVENLRQGLEAVHQNRADAVLDNQDVLAWLLEENAIPDMRLIQVKELFRGNTNLRMGVSRHYPLLASILRKALAAIPEEEQQRFLSRWLPAGREMEAERVYLSLEEQEWLNEHPRVRVGADPAWPPVAFLNNDGEYLGMASDYLSLLSSWLGMQTEVYQASSWKDVLEQARAGKIDLLPAVVASEERREYLLFTRPYLSFPVVVFTRKDAPLQTGLADLRGRRVVVEEGHRMEEILRDRYPDIHLITRETTLSALKELAVGRVDAYVGNLTTASTLLQQHGLGNIKVAAPTPYSLDLSMGVRKDWPELIGILDKLLGSMDTEQQAAIRKKWLQVDYAVKMDYQLLWRVVILSLVVMLVILIWMSQIRSQKERLQRSEAQLTRILQAIPIPIVVAETDGTLVLANPQAAREVESDKDDMVGRNMNEFYADPKERQEIVQRLMEEGRVDRFPVHLRTDKGNSMEGLMSAIPIELEGRTVNLGMFFNLTDRLRMEKELGRAKAEAEKANAFKSRFLANMSHEIRTPMNAILGLVHLCSRTSLDAGQRNYLNHMESSARALLNIINDILDLSRIEAGRLEPDHAEFALWEVLEQVGTLNAVAAVDKGLELLFRVQPDLPERYLGDASHLSQVMINLVQNAIKFTEQGEVVVDIALASRTDSTATLAFSVRDTGMGIAEKDLPHIFDAFTQVDQSYRRRFGGTGLGLAISKMLVELMGGHIEVQSKPGEGSCFRFFLNFDIVSGKVDGESGSLAGRTAMLVEGNASARMILQEMLRGFGMRTRVSDDLEQALCELEEAADPWPDAAILGQAQLNPSRQQRLRQLMDGGLKLFVLQQVGEEFSLSPDVAGYLHKPVIPWLLKMKLLSVLEAVPGGVPDRRAMSVGRRFRGEVLLVEDNRINQLVAREILEQLGLFVQVADNGGEALKMLSARRYDLVFLDIQMPDMDGYELARRIRENPEWQELPLLAMTAHALVGDREKSLQAGMNDHLSKPIDFVKLVEALEKWLPETAIVSDTAAGESVEPPVFQLQYVDVPWGVERTGGNFSLFRLLLQQFLEDHEDTVRELEELLLENDREGARRLVHTMRGVTATIGARKLERATELLEQALARGEEERLRFALEEFRRNFAWVIDDLHHLLDGQKTGSGEDRRAVGKTSVDVVLREALTLAGNGSPEALEKILMIDPVLLDEHHRDRLEELKQELRNYEFSRAKRILGDLIEDRGGERGPASQNPDY